MATAATDVTHVTPAVTVDLLDYVREHLANTPPTSWARYQAAVGVSERTLYNIRDGKVDPGYSKVKKLYESMKKAEAEASAQ
jgi:predicted transcriptional regulator